MLAWVTEFLETAENACFTPVHALACETLGTYPFGGRRQRNF